MSEEPEVWCVMTMKGGEVSLLKNLTADECRAVVQRINGYDPWSQEVIYQRVLSGWAAGANAPQGYASFYRGPVQQGWGMERCEWWGSRGGELVIWPKPADYESRLAEAAKVAAVVKSTNAKIAA